jgi:threonine/homoserine/homoserine lactone efflux protein
MTLVVTSSLARGFGAGLRVAMAPLLTDIPIVLLSLLLFNTLPPVFELALTLFGGFFVVYLGVETVRAGRHASLALAGATATAAGADVVRGMAVNAVSPHPWLFWITVGSPALTRAWQIAPWQALAFLLGFFSLLVGGKIAVAFAVAGGRRFLSDPWYRRLLVASGLLLSVFGLLLLGSAVQRML